VDKLKTRLIDEWEYFHQSIVNVAIAEWRRCLSACVRVSGHTSSTNSTKYINLAILSSSYERLLSLWKVDEVLTKELFTISAETL